MNKFSFPTLALSHLLVAAAAALATQQWFNEVPQPAPSAIDSAATTLPAPTEPALFRVGERRYRFYDLPIEYRQPLHEIRKFAYQQQMLLIEEAVVEAYIQQQMAAQGLERMAVQATLLPGAEPRETEINQFYAQNQSQSAPPLAQIRAELVSYLTAAKQEQLKKQLLTRLLVNGEAQMLIDAPQLERPADATP